MREELLISSPFTESWVAWLMLLMLIGLGAVNIFRPGLFWNAIISLPTTKERDSIFVGSGTDNRSEVLLMGYEVLMGALTMQWALQGDDFTIGRYAILVGITAGALLTRRIMQTVVGFVFFERRDLVTYYRHYRYLLDCLMLALYPITLMALFCPWEGCIPVARVLVIVLLALALACLIYKIIACFRMQLEAILLIPLYILTVEVLPLAAMVYLATASF